jgi:peptidoglycan/xylan/chitin deacetylase (PgdA/CDA1 family)
MVKICISILIILSLLIQYCSSQAIYSFKNIGAISTKTIALTFDDGPHAVLTPRLLDVLKQKNVKVTFFVMGVKAVIHPNILEREKSEGHEVANHVWDHPVISKISREVLHEQIEKTNNAINKAIGNIPLTMRPPYGNTNPKLNDHIKKNEQLSVIQWSYDTNDWKRPTPEELIKKSLKNVKAGDVILCHDIHPGTIEAMPKLIDGLKELGFNFATVSEMIELEKKDNQSKRNLRIVD